METPKEAAALAKRRVMVADAQAELMRWFTEGKLRATVAATLDLADRICVIDDGRVVVSGGRVLCVTALGDSVRQAQRVAYAAVAAGGTVAVPKMPIPTMGWLAYCKDTEGNIFGMMQMDPAAA